MPTVNLVATEEAIAVEVRTDIPVRDEKSGRWFDAEY